ncbi:MAG: serine/threonine-protein kinase, partial [Planctomycetota bacterium]|nr:serine/threonine-protein kinase [Planctomycetota bacterium]
DIKPDNIMITRDGVAKLCDLGLAREEGSDAFSTQPGQAVGTPHYISPEQATGEKDIDIRSDLYSLGATLYHMLSGSTPYPSDSASVVMAKHITEAVQPLKERQPGVSVTICAIVAKMIMKQKGDRYQTPADLMADIEKALEEKPPVHAKVAFPRPITRKAFAGQADGAKEGPERAKRGMLPLVLSAAAALAIVVVAAAVLIPMLTRKPEDNTPDAAGNTTTSNPSGNGQSRPPKTDPGTDMTAIERELDRKAREELDAIFARQARIEGDFSQIAVVNTRFDEYLFRYKGTKWEVEGLNAQQDFAAACEKHGETALAGLIEKMKPLEQSGRLYEAARVFEAFPGELVKTAANVKALAEKGRLLEAMAAKFSADIQATDGFVAQKDFEKGLAVLDGVKTYASPPLVSEAEAKAKTVQTEKEACAAKIRLKAQELYAAFQQKLWAMLDNKKRNYSGAQRLVDEALKNPELATMRSEIRDDLRDVELLMGFWQDVERGMDQCVESKEDVQLSLFKDMPGRIIRKNKKPFIELATGGSNPVFALDLEKMKEEDVLFFASKVLTRDDGISQLKMGLFCFYAANVKKAREHLQKAADKGEQRARAYLARIQAAEMGEEEKHAGAMLDEARALFKADKLAEAHKILTELLAKYAALSVVKTNLEEIKKMIAEIEAKVATVESSPLQKLLKGKVKKLAGDRVEVLYDFTADDQLSDWEPGPGLGGGGGGEWKRDGTKAGLLGSNCSRAFIWKPPTIGDVTIEASVVMLDDRNVGITVCDDRRGRAYLGAVGLQIPRMGDWGGNNSPNALMKTDVARGLNANALRELGGRTSPKLARNSTYILRIQRVGKQILFSIGNDVIANTSDAEFTRGFVSLWLFNSSAFFNSVKITCTVDPEWLKGPTGPDPR